MPKYLVIGDKNQYVIESQNINEAWYCAEAEIKYGETGNTKIINIVPKRERNG